MRKLSTLITLAVLAALGWGLYWFIGAQATEQALGAWLKDRARDGWTASAEIETAGFPNRFDTTLTDVVLDDPDTGTGWSAPWFQLLSLSYKPTQVIAVWPEEQELRLPGETVGIASERMIGSVALGVSPSLPLERLVVELGDVALASSRGWQAAAAAGQVALRETPLGAGEGAGEGEGEARAAPVYDLALSLDGFAPESPDVARLRRLADLPETIETLSAELTVTFDKGWDLTALEDRRPQPRKIVLSELTARWGDLALAGSGEVSVDAAGIGTGTLALEVTNWRDLLVLAEATGALKAGQVPLVTRALEGLAALSGDPNRLEVPLRFAEGYVLIGPLPVGAAPVFEIP